MVIPDFEFYSQYIAQKSNYSPAQLHSEECPLGSAHQTCLKSEAVSVLRSAPLDIDLKATPRHRISVSSQTLNHSENVRSLNVTDEEFDLTPVDAFQKRGQEASVELYVDSTGSLRLTQCGMLQEVRRRKRPLSDPLYPNFEELGIRKATYDHGRDFDHLSVQEAARVAERYAKNGFYVNDDGVVTCFHCGISFMRNMLVDTTWNAERYHARWSPYCAHLLYRKGRDFVQSVLEDTRRIHMERNGYRESLEPEVIQTLVDEGYDEERIRTFVDHIHDSTGWYPDRNVILRGIQ